MTTSLDTAAGRPANRRRISFPVFPPSYMSIRLTYFPPKVKPAFKPPHLSANLRVTWTERMIQAIGGTDLEQRSMNIRNLRRDAKRIGAAAFILAASCMTADAHPHLTVVARAEILLDQSGKITGIRHAWTFDEAYSAFAVTGMKKGPDGKIARKELTDLAKLNVESLSDFKYFTFLKQGSKELAFAEPKPGYYLDHDGAALTLHFDLPLKAPVAPANGQSLRIDDETIFVAFSLADGEPVKFSAPAGTCKVEIKRPATTMTGANAPKLTEDFFNNLKAGFSEQYATTARIVCP